MPCAVLGLHILEMNVHREPREKAAAVTVSCVLHPVPRFRAEESFSNYTRPSVSLFLKWKSAYLPHRALVYNV